MNWNRNGVGGFKFRRIWEGNSGLLIHEDIHFMEISDREIGPEEKSN